MTSSSHPAVGTRDESDLAWLLRQRLLELLRIPSPSGAEKQLADWFEIRLRSTPGAKVERIGDNLLFTRGDAWPERPLILCGHLDTVPPQDNEKPRGEGDRIFGLGASDLKAGLAVLRTLLERVPTSSRGQPVYAFNACEEVAFERSGLVQLSQAAPWLRQARFALCVEPTENPVEVGCLGTLHAEVTVHGRTAHSARPWLGENAVHEAARIIGRIAERKPREVRPSGPEGPRYREVVSVTHVEGGTARNVIPGEARFNVNLRFGPDLSRRQARERLLEWIGAGPTVRFTDEAPAGRDASDDPTCRLLRRLSGKPFRA